MLIELKWLDNNKTKNYKTEIYRSDTPFDSISDATLLATVEANIGSYADKDVIQGNMYYYRFRNIRGNTVSALSNLFEFEADQYNGPGPQRLNFGDEHFGYYGTFPEDPNIVPTLNQVRDALGLVPLLGDEANAVLHKFAIGGTVRGIHSAPLTYGFELGRDNPLLLPLLNGGFLTITLGLHTWAVILPSVGHSQNANPSIVHFPGELRSMLGVITDMYSRVEAAVTGNNTGNRLLSDTGRISFFDVIDGRFEIGMKWIASSDQLDNNFSTSIDWTQANGPPPLAPKELHIEDVDYNNIDNWYDTIIWPVIIYTGLVGPE